ncbi:MAG: Ppx/GppA family phosphatase, partial [Sphingomonas bacterium]|nr:Ppx/GppA family phosphatase [Sphingomonas bacterium]
IAWGKAIRLAQRLSGGTEALLRRSSLTLRDRRIILTVQPRYRELASGAVERRLAQLAKALGRIPEIAFG